MSIELHPVENMALTAARAQVERGDDPTPNVAAMCIMTLARLVDGKSFADVYAPDLYDETLEDDKWPDNARV